MNRRCDEVIHIDDDIPVKIEKEFIKLEDGITNNDKCAMRNGEMKNGSSHTVDTATQTKNIDMTMALKGLIKQRMWQYQEAFVKEEMINKKMDPSFSKVQRENTELKKELQILRGRVEKLERRGIKRPSEILSPDQSRKELKPTLSPLRVPTSQLSMSTDKSEQAHLQIRSQRFIKPSPVNTTLYRQQPPAPQAQGLVHHRYGAPVQMVAPVQQINSPQPLQRHPYAINDQQRFVLLDENNQIIGGHLSGVNTQVVAANQGLRMTAMPPNLQQMQRLPIHNPLPSNNVQRPTTNNLPNNFNSYQYNANRIPTSNGNMHKKIVQSPPNVRHVPQQTYQPIPIRSNAQQDNSTQGNKTLKKLPKLKASISASGNGIILTWDCEQSAANQETYRKVECYHLFAHQAKDNRVTPPTDIKQWKKIGVVKALPLPMACTLTQFATGNVYFFAVLAVDIHGRESELSNPCIIRLNLDS